MAEEFRLHVTEAATALSSGGAYCCPVAGCRFVLEVPEPEVRASFDAPFANNRVVFTGVAASEVEGRLEAHCLSHSPVDLMVVIVRLQREVARLRVANAFEVPESLLVRGGSDDA